MVSSILTHPPGIFGGVVVHDGPDDHDLGATALEEGLLVLLAHLVERADLLGHLDHPLNRQPGQVYHGDQAITARNLVLE